MVSLPKASSFYLVYAYDSPDHGQVNDRAVEQSICDFESMHTKIAFERCIDLQDMVRTDLFHNKACLLHKRFAIRPVDLLLLFHTEALSSYCGEEKSRNYMSQLKEICKLMLKEVYTRTKECSHMKQSASKISGNSRPS